MVFGVAGPKCPVDINGRDRNEGEVSFCIDVGLPGNGDSYRGLLSWNIEGQAARRIGRAVLCRAAEQAARTGIGVHVGVSRMRRSCVLSPAILP